MSTETYIPTLTEHEHRMRHKQPIEITPEPGKPTISQLIRRALDTGETTLSQLAQAANLSCHCIRNMRDGNPDRQKSVNYETARPIAAVLDVDDPYKIQWPCAFGDKGRPHESTGAMPIVNPDEIRRDADDPTVHYRRVDGRWKPFCNNCYQPMYVRMHRLTCDNCTPE